MSKQQLRIHRLAYTNSAAFNKWLKKYQNLSWLFPASQAINAGGAAALDYFWKGVGSAVGSVVSTGLNYGKDYWQNRMNRVEKYRADLMNSPEMQMRRMKRTGINPFAYVNRIDPQTFTPFEWNYGDYGSQMAQNYNSYASANSQLSNIPRNETQSQLNQVNANKGLFELSFLMPQTKEKRELNLQIQRLENAWQKGHFEQIARMRYNTEALAYKVYSQQFCEYYKMHEYTYTDKDGLTWELIPHVDDSSGSVFFMSTSFADGHFIDRKPTAEDWAALTPNLYHTLQSYLFDLEQQSGNIALTRARTWLTNMQAVGENLSNFWKNINNLRYDYTWQTFLKTGVFIDSDSEFMRSFIPGQTAARWATGYQVSKDIFGGLLNLYTKGMSSAAKRSINNYGNKVQYGNQYNNY